MLRPFQIAGRCFWRRTEEGETPEQVVKRECMEELSYELSHPRHFKVHTVRHEGMDYVIHLFTERYNWAELTLGEGQGWAGLAEETHGPGHRP